MALLRRIAIRKRIDIDITIRDWRRSARFWVIAQIFTMVPLFLFCVNTYQLHGSGEGSRQVRKLTNWDYASLYNSPRSFEHDERSDTNLKFANLGNVVNDPPRAMLRANDPQSNSGYEQSPKGIDSDRMPDTSGEYIHNGGLFGHNSTDREHKTHHQTSSASEPRNESSVRPSATLGSVGPDRRIRLTENGEPCGMRQFLLFGMRPRWQKICRSESQYQDLMVFPRVISCKRCSVLLNYSETPADIAGGYDVVIFTNVYEWLSPNMWKWAHGNRTTGQRWVMITQESPFYVSGIRPPLKYGNVTYDWLDSYHRSSDFYHPYGWFSPFRIKREGDIDVTNFMSRKTHLMAWMASHCETLQWDRQGFVKDLMEHLDIDTYGKCGEREIRWNKERLYTALLTKYKFYLSLENSCCEEYVTEKFWRSLKLGMVPVVIGAPLEYYEMVAPPNSFLHVDMFDSMEDMVSYIRELDSNHTKFIAYFRWRTMGQLTSRPTVDQFILPLTNRTHCSILHKYLHRNQGEKRRIDYYNSDWHNSCSSCGKKSWMGKYMYDSNHTRLNEDIWA